MRLVGNHQHRNAEAAVTAALVLRQQGFPRVSIEAIMRGLAEAHLPGRFEVGSERGCRHLTSLLSPSELPGAAAVIVASRAHVWRLTLDSKS